MAGDLSKWSSPDIPVSERNDVKFQRKGGWFVTKKILIAALIFVFIIVIVAIAVTKELTASLYKPITVETHNESESSPTLVPLSEDIIPKHYNVRLKPYLDIAPKDEVPFTLSGEVDIHAEVLKPTSTVTFHYAGSNISYLNAYNNLNRSLIIKSDKYIKSLELYSVEFEETLQPGFAYFIQIKFNTSIGDEQKGFYRYKYNTGDLGKQRWMGVTQLVPSFARRLFPCFDEPKFRTTVDMSVHRLKNMSALANTNKKLSISDPENTAWIWDIFEVLPPIPVHKLGIILADLTVSKIPDDNFTLSIWTRSDLQNGAINLMDVTNSLLKFYQSYFTAVQPIKKIDLIAIPDYINDHSGAWGLIPFRESLIFAKDDTRNEAKFAYEISQKLSEQWFGCLVSMHSWSHMWIKDSLSIYTAYQALNKVRPNYEIKSSFLIDVVQKALASESYTIENKYGDITDSDNTLNQSALKGASLLHMITSLTSYKDIREGINSYLEKWLLKTSNPDNLWESFNKTFDGRLDVVKFVKNWLQTGYPVVNSQFNRKEEQVMIEQNPFYFEQAPHGNSAWDVPITYISDKMLSNENPRKIWLDRSDKGLKLVLHKNESWILLNLPQLGAQAFYRVNYDNTTWNSLIKEIGEENSKLQDADKAMLLDDAYQLAKVGSRYLNGYLIPFKLTFKSLEKASLLPLRAAEIHLNFLQQFYHNEPLFKDFIKRIFTPLLNQTNISVLDVGDSLPNKYLRDIIVKWSCQYEMSDCLNWTRSTFTSWMAEFNNLTKLLPDVVLKSGIRLSTVHDLNNILNRSLSYGVLPKERLQLLSSLTSSENLSFIMGLLEKTIDLKSDTNERKFNNEEVMEIWKSVSDNYYLKEEVFKFFLKNWNNINKKYHNNPKVLEAIITAATDGLTEEKHLTEISSLNERVERDAKKPLPALLSSIQKLIANTAWRSSKYVSVKELLR